MQSHIEVFINVLITVDSTMGEFAIEGILKDHINRILQKSIYIKNKYRLADMSVDSNNLPYQPIYDEYIARFYLYTTDFTIKPIDICKNIIDLIEYNTDNINRMYNNLTIESVKPYSKDRVDNQILSSSMVDNNISPYTYGVSIEVPDQAERYLRGLVTSKVGKIIHTLHNTDNFYVDVDPVTNNIFIDTDSYDIELDDKYTTDICQSDYISYKKLKKSLDKLNVRCTEFRGLDNIVN
jgi:hypothetical protein